MDDADRLKVIEGFIRLAYLPFDEESLPEVVSLGIVLGVFRKDSDAVRAAAFHVSELARKDAFSAAGKEVDLIQAEIKTFLRWLFENLDTDRYLEFKIGCQFSWHSKFVLHQSQKDHHPVKATVCAYSGAMPGAPVSKISFPGFFFKLMVALSGFPKGTLGRCERCGKIFFNATNRRKIYCGVRCQTADAVDRARQKKKEG
jgi:hypothetical protein